MTLKMPGTTPHSLFPATVVNNAMRLSAVAAAGRTRWAAGLLTMIEMTVLKVQRRKLCAFRNIFWYFCIYFLLISIIPSNWRQGSDFGDYEARRRTRRTRMARRKTRTSRQ